MKFEIEKLKIENNNLNYLCRKNQILNRDFEDFNEAVKMKGMVAETMDKNKDAPFFPDKPVWQQIKRKTEVSAKIKKVFSQSKLDSKSLIDFDEQNKNDFEVKSFISNKNIGRPSVNQMKQMVTTNSKQITPSNILYDNVYNNTMKSIII